MGILHQVTSESKSSPVTCCDSYAIMQINKMFHEFKKKKILISGKSIQSAFLSDIYQTRYLPEAII